MRDYCLLYLISFYRHIKSEKANSPKALELTREIYVLISLLGYSHQKTSLLEEVLAYRVLHRSTVMVQAAKIKISHVRQKTSEIQLYYGLKLNDEFIAI